METNWIPVNTDDPATFPEVNEEGYSEYILLSYDNFNLIDIGEYRVDKDGNGAFYPGDDTRSCVSYGFIVNAWMPMIEPYRGEEWMKEG